MQHTLRHPPTGLAIHRLVLLLALSIPLSVAAAPIPKALKKKAASLVGAWEVIDAKGEVWTFAEDGTAAYGHGRPPAGSAVYRVNDDAAPREIDWSQDADRRQWNLGLFEVDGDRLTLNFSAPGRPRVATLAEAGTARRLQLRRVKE